MQQVRELLERLGQENLLLFLLLVVGYAFCIRLGGRSLVRLRLEEGSAKVSGIHYNVFRKA